MKRKLKNQNDGVQSKIIVVSGKILPIWKILISWVGFGVVFYVSTQLLRGVLANFFLCFGMVGVLTYQYGMGSLSSLFGRMKKGTKRWLLFYLVMGFAAPLLLDIMINPNLAAHVSMSSTKHLPLLDFLADMLIMFVGLIGEEAGVAALAFPLFGLINQFRGLKKNAFFLSALISSVIFGIGHLPVYQSNWIKCIFVIGLPRIFYNYAWKKTDSLWGGIWVHSLNNWIAYGLNYFSDLTKPKH